VNVFPVTTVFSVYSNLSVFTSIYVTADYALLVIISSNSLTSKDTQTCLRNGRFKENIRRWVIPAAPLPEIIILVTNSMEPSPRWETTSRSAAQDFSKISTEPKIQLHVHKNSPPYRYSNPRPYGL
jgi:hypothetical protein